MEFIGPVLRDAMYYSLTGSRTFLYSFDFLSSQAEAQVTDPRLRGVSHATDLQYLYKTPGYNTADDLVTQNAVCNLWTNFILNGNPTPPLGGINVGFTWPEFDSNHAYASLGPKPSAANDFHPSSMFFACEAPKIDGRQGPFCTSSSGNYLQNANIPPIL